MSGQRSITRTCLVYWAGRGEFARSMLGMGWGGDQWFPPDNSLVCDRLEITGQHQDQGGRFAIIEVRWSNGVTL